MVVVAESVPGYKVRYRLGKTGEAVYGGDGFVQPAMTLTEAERLRKSIIDRLGVLPDSLELVPLGEVDQVEESGPLRSMPAINRTQPALSK